MEITTPSPENDQHFLKKLVAPWFVPPVIYYELKSLIVPVAGAESDPKI